MWKTILGHCIYESPTGTRVFQNPVYRWLKFDSKAIQSLINRYFPHRPELSYLKPLILPGQLQPGNCCMLGLGGGGAAHALSPYLGDTKLTIVESNEEVINIAKRFFMIDKLTNLSIIHQDASLFVRDYKSEFQHILVDLFTANAFPDHCSNEAFFADCKRLLKPEGVLAVNLANSHEHWPVFQLIQKQFLRSTITFPVAGSANMIILAQNSSSPNSFIDTLKKSHTLRRLAWDGKWGCIATMR